MTQEEKAKAYDEVLERVKPLYEWAKKDDSPMWSTYEYLFPELRESEDEKVRKFLVRLAERCSENSIDFIGDIKKADVLTWLEKQKDSGPKSSDNWKPSEDQMNVLLNTEGMIRASGYPENAKVLASLYEALKKL